MAALAAQALEYHRSLFTCRSFCVFYYALLVSSSPRFSFFPVAFGCEQRATASKSNRGYYNIEQRTRTATQDYAIIDLF